MVLSADGGAAVLGVNNTPNISVNAAGNQISISTGNAGVGVGKIVVLEDSVTVSEDMDVTGDLDVTGTITSNAFAYSKATVNNAADILYTAFNSFAGKRIINTASATNTTYGLPTPVAADIGKS